MDLYKILDMLDIKYDELNHIPVFTSTEARLIKENIVGIGCKNLFLTDGKGRYFILMIEDCKKADIKKVSKSVNVSHLSFGKITELKDILNLDLGSVTPMGIINDREKLVTVLIDRKLKNKKLLVHPNINTKTLSINYEDLIRFIEYEEHRYIII